MKVYTFPQGGDEWNIARLGLPTASEFHKIVAPTTGKLSMSRDKKGAPAAKVLNHAYRLTAETLTQRSFGPDLDRIEHIMRGKNEEPYALARFAEVYEVRVQTVGLITTDDGRLGASPDGVISPRLITEWQPGDPVITLEAKAPDAPVMIGYIYEEGFGDDYLPQAMGQLLVAEAERAVRYAYNASFLSICDEKARDEEYIGNLRQALGDFCSIRDAVLEKIKAHGFFTASGQQPMTAPDQFVEQAERDLTTFTQIRDIDQWKEVYAKEISYLDAERRDRVLEMADYRRAFLAAGTP